MQKKKSPTFPLIFIWPDGETTVDESEYEMAMDLEFFDSSDESGEMEQVQIMDLTGHRVRVRIENQDTIWCERILNE